MITIKTAKKQKLKESKGITLIALVITIIVLLILAGVTIATLTGDNGILKKAGDAKTQTEQAKEDENLSKQTLDTEILNSVTSNWITNTFSTLISYQIYNMFPFFGEIRQFFEKAVEGAGESLFEVAGIFIPQSKLLSFAKSSLDKFTKESNEQKSKNNLKKAAT